MATLYGQKDNFRAQKILAAAKFGGNKVNVKDATPPTDKFPLGLTPALEMGGKALTGDAGILWEVSGSKLKGQTAADASGVVGWLGTAESDFAPAVLGWVLPSVSVLRMDKKAVDAAKAETLALLGSLDAFLVSRTFLVGQRLSLADLSLAFNLLPAFQHVLDESARSGLQCVTRWLKTVMGQPEVAEVVGSVVFCTKPAQFDAAKFAEQAPKAEAASKGGKKDKKEKKKADKPAPEPKEEDLDATEAALAEEPKKKGDPFDAFPKSQFNMDEFKRVYSNEDTETKAVPFLLDNIDWENNSVWLGEYKFPEELGQIFMSCNLVGGMFQRLDKLRKTAFASVAIFGDNSASTISGIWMWRGHELAFPLSPDWQTDYESYNWTKLDPQAEKTKKMIKEYLMWEGDFDGKKFNQGKIFK